MTYTFECQKCKYKEEVEIPMSEYDKEKNKQLCKNCGNPAPMIRVFEPIGLTVYNCRGFYDTDSRGVMGR